MSATPACSDPLDRRAALALAFAEGVGCVGYRELVGRHGSAAAAFRDAVAPRAQDDAIAQADAALDAGRRAGARLLVLGDAEYPPPLLDLRDPPPFLFALGDVAALEAPGLAVVGTRRATPGGERTAYRIGAAVARAAGCLVSGMARGIDGAAHRGALDAGGLTVAVLGGGVDVPYPVMHRALYDAIIARGVAISEAVPGAPPVAGAFPRRNRIIAALGRAVVVVEAGTRSGARITADAAIDIGRPLGAIPGSIDAPQCVGSNLMLRNGATLITDPTDALMLAGLSPSPGSDARSREALAWEPRVDSRDAARDRDEEAVLDAVRRGAGDVVEVSRLTSLAPRTIGAALVALELAGHLWTDHAGGIRLAR